jgi:hypothetical protein
MIDGAEPHAVEDEFDQVVCGRRGDIEIHLSCLAPELSSRVSVRPTKLLLSHTMQPNQIAFN